MVDYNRPVVDVGFGLEREARRARGFGRITVVPQEPVQDLAFDGATLTHAVFQPGDLFPPGFPVVVEAREDGHGSLLATHYRK
jgi:hypothetical protein